MIALEGGSYGGIIILFIAIMVEPPIFLTIIGLSIRKKYLKAAKVLYILATVYLIAGLGICGSMF
ncbi:hypothetical protein [Flavobacterium sp.]|jgi:hypothetical protein|uniref:hypothetical protein n=1 Tax=Flavobacterium sp. TaxID=239 RepID=UPI0037BEC73C